MAEKTTLADASERVDYGLTTSAVHGGDGPRFLRITDIDGPHIDWTSVPRCAASPSEIERYRLLDGDIVIARTGASTGRSQWVQTVEPAVFASYLVRFRINREHDSRFVSYVLQADGWSDYVGGLAHGKSAQPNMSARDMGAFAFEAPSLVEQRAIAEVLGALDDKIAANTRLAATADEWVRATWSRTCLNTGTTRRVASLADSIRDLSDPRDAASDHVYVGLEHIPRRQMWLPDHGLADSVTSAKSGFVEGDVLFGKLRPYFHKVVAAPKSGICSTDVLVVRAQEPTLRGFVLAALASDATVAAATASSEGTRMPRTSWKDLAAIEVPWPGSGAAEAFSSEVEALRATVDARLAENLALAATRDALLPALMSGKLRVRDAERIVEGAV